MSEELTKYDQKLEFILRNAARIFAEKGYHSTSMRDISRETKVSLAGLYHYCRSKDELLFLIQDNCFRRVLETAKSSLLHTLNPIDSLRAFIENHLAFFTANMSEMKVLSHESESLRGEMGKQVSYTKRQYTKLAQELLSNIQRSSGNEVEDVDLTVATFALFGMMNWIYNWYDPTGKLSVKELIDNLTRLFLNGFAGTNSFASPIRDGLAGRERMSVWRTDDY
jgi:TetR/AcrR family transcriptional regulator, cholesterol catabolism regulator